MINHILLACSWLLYVFLHSLLAALSFKAVVERLAGKKIFSYYRLMYSIFAALSLVAILYYQYRITSWLIFDPSAMVAVISVMLAVTGLALMIACVRKYFLYLSGVDVLTNKDYQPVLEENGLHGIVRHPLYLGTLLFIWALFLLFPYANNLVACTIITLYTLVGIGFEEKKLFKEYGESYRNYSSKVPRLIPSWTILKTFTYKGRKSGLKTS